jgi:hypothetical protein
MKGTWIRYSAEELAWIEEHRDLPRKEAHSAFLALFGRTDVALDNYIGLCKRKGWTTGRTGRFDKGSTPANKGKKMPYNANCARTQFKKGQLPHNTKYLGHERVSKDGYTEISIAETNPHTGFERRYVLKHKYLWEQAHGPVPEGMLLKCLDGNRLNTDPSNWTLVPRGALPFMNGHRGPNYNSADPEVRPTILALAKLRHLRSAKARSTRRQEREEPSA